LKLRGTKLYSVGIKRHGESIGRCTTGFGAGRAEPALTDAKDTKIHQHQNNKNSAHALIPYQVIPHQELTLMGALR
jgi:hypothetical protein